MRAAVEYLWKLAALAFVVLLLAFVGTRLWPDGGPYAPLGDYLNPQIVTNEGKQAVAGGSVFVQGRKCNLSDEPVSIEGIAYFRRLEPTERFVGHFAGTRLLEPGCVSATWENQLPADVTPGVWIIAGMDTVRRGSEWQTISWQSERFEVIP